MELATFGAIMTFAMELEKQAADFYTKSGHVTLDEIFNGLALDTNKRIKRVERTRREGVAEMILEPITGFNSNAYDVELTPGSVEKELLEQAIILEETTRRFYFDAAKKIPVREVARTFERMAKENVRRLAILKER
jgi:rubrerythrin